MVGARCQRGQASVELVGALPLLVVAALAAAHFALAGFALWSAANAARVGARAAHVGADVERAAERAVPAPFQATASREGARVRVRVRPPALLPFMPRPTLSAAAALEPGAR